MKGVSHKIIYKLKYTYFTCTERMLLMAEGWIITEYSYSTIVIYFVKLMILHCLDKLFVIANTHAILFKNLHYVCITQHS